jgi:ubiquinone/menaquinone biosynthesis C-methylase UbiE
LFWSREIEQMKVNWPERIWINSPVRAWVQRREIAFFEKSRPLEPGSLCLEIGCGRGKGVELVHHTFHPRRVDGMDIDPLMIGLAKKRFQGNARGLSFFLVADAQHLPYPDACMDAVFNFGIIHHLEDWEKGIREIARVLVQGGLFFCEEIYPPLYANLLFRRLVAHPTENRFHGVQFRAALSASGLRLMPDFKESRFGILGIAQKGNA